VYRLTGSALRSPGPLRRPFSAFLLARFAGTSSIGDRAALAGRDADQLQDRVVLACGADAHRTYHARGSRAQTSSRESSNASTSSDRRASARERKHGYLPNAIALNSSMSVRGCSARRLPASSAPPPTKLVLLIGRRSSYLGVDRVSADPRCGCAPRPARPAIAGAGAVRRRLALDAFASGRISRKQSESSSARAGQPLRRPVFVLMPIFAPPSSTRTAHAGLSDGRVLLRRAGRCSLFGGAPLATRRSVDRPRRLIIVACRPFGRGLYRFFVRAVVWWHAMPGRRRHSLSSCRWRRAHHHPTIRRRLQARRVMCFYMMAVSGHGGLSAH